MSMALWNEPLPADERERLIAQVVDAVVKRGLQSPAILALEMNRPLTFIASQGLISLAPMVAPLIGLERTQAVSRLLAEPQVVDELVARLEATMETRERKGNA